MIINSGITVGAGVSIIPDITYTAGLFKTTYSGYFADPDGHPWEIAWNPHFELEQGCLVLPD